MENETLASELLKELKCSSRRWFIAFLVMVLTEVLTVIGIFWYATLPVEEWTIEQESDNGSYNLINNGESEIYNGGKAENQL